MELIWGVILFVLTLIAWVGQLIYAISPKLGAKLGVGEAESEVDPVFFVDARGEAIWDSLVIWTLPVAALLLIFENPLWTYFGLVGGGCYLYFCGRNLSTRFLMQRKGFRIGTQSNIRMGYMFISLWGIAAVITIVMASLSL